MENNPFFVKPVSVLDALAYGIKGFDQASKTAKANKLEQARQNALLKMQAGDTQGAFAETLGAGDTDAAKAVATFAENQANRAFRESEAGRAQQNADRSYGVQQAQLGLQRATLEQGRLPPGYRRTADGNMERVPGGPADTAPEVPFDNEQKLRKEFEGNIKPYLETRRGYERLIASKDTAAGDISAIFGYMKMLDPGSVVREGEFATAQNAAGIPDQIRNLYNKAITGERLNPNQRQMFKSQADSLYGAARGEYETREKQTRAISQQYGLDANRIIVPLGRVSAGGPAIDMPPPPAGYQLVK
jgi:hypothetical protein